MANTNIRVCLRTCVCVWVMVVIIWHNTDFLSSGPEGHCPADPSHLISACWWWCWWWWWTLMCINTLQSVIRSGVENHWHNASKAARFSSFNICGITMFFYLVQSLTLQNRSFLSWLPHLWEHFQYGTEPEWVMLQNRVFLFHQFKRKKETWNCTFFPMAFLCLSAFYHIPLFCMLFLFLFDLKQLLNLNHLICASIILTSTRVLHSYSNLIS